MADDLLHIDDLKVRFATDRGIADAVAGVSLTLNRGETLAILGESGSGKSVMAQAILGIVPSPPGTVQAKALRLNGADLLTLPGPELRRKRGREMALIFQDAMTSLNPRFTIGTQICEILRVHLGLSRRAAKDRAAELLADVGIPDPKARLKNYPHQFSGGMRQRALIAMAIALSPDLLIADEPTTALDVTVQAQILELLMEIQARDGMGLILITHDLAVARSVTQRVAVMYAGRFVEEASTHDIFTQAHHPYTQGLLRSTPTEATVAGKLKPIGGSPPDLVALPNGCAFHPRCPKAMPMCTELSPRATSVGERHRLRCHLAETVDA